MAVCGGISINRLFVYTFLLAAALIFLVVTKYDNSWEGRATPSVPLFKQMAADDWTVKQADLEAEQKPLAIEDIEKSLKDQPVESLAEFEKKLDKNSKLADLKKDKLAGVVKLDKNKTFKGHNATLERYLVAGEVNRTNYPKRLNMGVCQPLFGKVVVFVAYMKSSYETHYQVAQDSLKCYLASANYTLLLVDLYNDTRVNDNCPHDQLFFKKHCAASVYLEDADWMLVLDADAGVVNPNHCIEEYIDDRVDLVFYERFFNWEIASGNYLVRNTPFARDFLRRWADWQYTQPANWNGADNGVLQIHILQSVMPGAKAEIKACESIWLRGTGYDTYMAYVTCVKVMLGAQRIWPGKIKIARRAHSFIRDGYLTTDKWSEYDFMLHGWKAQAIGADGWESPYSQMFNLTECGKGYSGWHYRLNKRVSYEVIRQELSNFEKMSGTNFPKDARVHPYLSEPDIGECYPHCDDQT
ncbi:unnamed protein product [Bursaphelenchus okinawaensis]|uniref:Uncharacterized protein n=1 Tax=Bursaphelenchus okinawaensis TaxID=465554 RepID=A0A811LJN3_9BILA|nr:unnamed protein product [Bursaphelenchus okinawaensis]CAG9123688.1 unnamed protein product [Bursaphelenchus okinawaensis]